MHMMYQTSYQLNCVSWEIGMAEHLYVLFAQIARVEDALFDVQFEQHWLHSQTARQAQGMAPLYPPIPCFRGLTFSK
jgi:hypothetical protein